MTFLKTKDGFKVYYEFLKKDKNKPVFVFIHGWLMNWTCFKKEIEYFKKKGYSILYLDLRGHGKSDKPEHKKDYSLNKMQEDIFQIIKKEKINKVIPVGHSMGGMISALFTLKHQIKVEKLILIDSSYKSPMYSSHFPILKKHEQFLRKATEFIRTKTKNKPQKIKETDFSKLEKEPVLKIMWESIKTTHHGSMFSALEAMYDYDLSGRLNEIKVPVLVIASNRDEIFSRKIQIAMSKKLNAKLAMKKGTHAIVIKQPNEIVKEIETFI